MNIKIKKYWITAVGIIFLVPTCSIFSQNINSSIIEEIEIDSEEKIIIDIPDHIKENILKTDLKNSNKSTGKGIVKTSGYRIQVFSDGRNQNTLESRAKARGNAILSRFPKYKGQIYTFSSSPNWFTRVGNFKTIAEANAALAELKKAFPGFTNEMRVVKSQIVVIK